MLGWILYLIKVLSENNANSGSSSQSSVSLSSGEAKNSNLGTVLSSGDSEYERLASPSGAGNFGQFIGYPSSALEDWFNSATGSDLTTAQRLSNQFSATQSALAWQREMYADSTKHQREMADMAKAGINPLMAGVSGSGSSVSAPAATAVSPGPVGSLNLGSILGAITSLAKTKAEIENIKADTEQKKANTENTNVDTEQKSAALKLFNDTAEIKKVLLGDEHEQYRWKKDVAEREVSAKESANTILQQQANSYTAMVDSQMSLIEEERLTEQSKRAELNALAREANANADYKVAMKALDEKYRIAQTENEKEELKILQAEARFKNGVYTEEYIEAVGKAANADADMKQCLSEYQRGDYHSASKSMERMFKKMEKNAAEGSWSVNSPYFGFSQAPSGIPGK